MRAKYHCAAGRQCAQRAQQRRACTLCCAISAARFLALYDGQGQSQIDQNLPAQANAPLLGARSGRNTRQVAVIRAYNGPYIVQMGRTYSMRSCLASRLSIGQQGQRQAQEWCPYFCFLHILFSTFYNSFCRRPTMALILADRSTAFSARPTCEPTRADFPLCSPQCMLQRSLLGKLKA